MASRTQPQEKLLRRQEEERGGRRTSGGGGVRRFVRGHIHGCEIFLGVRYYTRGCDKV